MNRVYRSDGTASNDPIRWGKSVTLPIVWVNSLPVCEVLERLSNVISGSLFFGIFEGGFEVPDDGVLV